MPAKSKAQQKFMGIVRSIQKGEQPASKFSKKAQDAAKDMKKKDAEDFASTKHKGLPKKVKEAFLSENPAASAAAAMVMMQMQNPDTGKKIKAITPLKDKDHKLHGKAKGIFKRLKDKFSKKKDKPVDKVAQYRALMQKEVEEGFGGDLKGSDKKKFEKARKENAEQLGYELTGTSDIKESIKEDGHTDVASAKRKLKTSVEDIKDIYSKLKGMSDEESLPSWWTDKITLSSNYLDKARDYITNPNESVSEGSFKTPLSPQKKDINKMKVRFKSDPRRVYTLKSVETGRVGGTSYMFAAPGNRKEHFTPKTWDLANKKGWLSLESVNERKNPKREKAKKNFSKYLKSMEKEIRGIKSFAKANQWGAISSFVDDGLVKDMKLLQKEIDTIIKLPIDESVNEAIEPQGNIKKVLDVAKNKQAKKIGGTLVDATTANMMTQVWDKVNDSSKEKMNKMNTKQLINLILRMWKAMGTPRV